MQFELEPTATGLQDSINDHQATAALHHIIFYQTVIFCIYCNVYHLETEIHIVMYLTSVCFVFYPFWEECAQAFISISVIFVCFRIFFSCTQIKSSKELVL